MSCGKTHGLVDHDQPRTGSGCTLQLFRALRGGQEALPAPALVVKDQRGGVFQHSRVLRPAVRDQFRCHPGDARQQPGQQAAAARVVVVPDPVARLDRAGNEDNACGSLCIDHDRFIFTAMSYTAMENSSK